MCTEKCADVENDGCGNVGLFFFNFVHYSAIIIHKHLLKLVTLVEYCSVKTSMK